MTRAAAGSVAPSAAVLVVVLAGGLCICPACSEPEPPQADADALYRDQYVFVGDRGTVMPLSLLRRGDGRAEAKGWLATGDRWESVYYQQLDVPLEVVPDVNRSARALSTARGTRARLDFDRTEDELAVSLRRPSSVVHLGARPVEDLGSSTDPEGPSRYAAGRATLRRSGERENGWLLIEETPASGAKRAFVEYGDYVLLFAVVDGRPVVARRSVGRDGYDNAFVGGSEVGHTARVELRRSAGELALTLEELGLSARGRVSDRSVSAGVAPSGVAVTYEVLLVRGDLAGAAFTIRPGDDT